MKSQEVASIKTSTIILAGLATLFLLSSWEFYCRQLQYQATPNDDKHLWAQHRARIDDLLDDDVVIIGSSRVMFNFQLDQWSSEYGKKPLMLAAAGSSVMPVLKDVVENSNYSGMLIIGVTPPLYFVPQSMSVVPYARIQKWVQHYYDRTYADRFSHFLSLNGPQQVFSFLTTSNEIFYNELDLRTVLERIPFPSRLPGPPPFPILYQVDHERNVNLMPQVTTDNDYALLVTNFWSAVFQPPPGATPSPEVVEENRKEIINESAALINAFKNRGGKVILVRCPSQNKVRAIESEFYPRDTYWEELVAAANSPAYHFEDHPFMNKYDLPEWSHLATPDAKKFTVDFVRQLKQDQLIYKVSKN